jgi:hypothetical protein
MEEALKFYEWLLKMKNVHLADHNRMSLAYDKVIENSNKLKTI